MKFKRKLVHNGKEVEVWEQVQSKTKAKVCNKNGLDAITKSLPDTKGSKSVEGPIRVPTMPKADGSN